MIYNSTMVDFYFVYKYNVGYILFKPQKCIMVIMKLVKYWESNAMYDDRILNLSVCFTCQNYVHLILGFYLVTFPKFLMCNDMQYFAQNIHTECKCANTIRFKGLVRLIETCFLDYQYFMIGRKRCKAQKMFCDPSRIFHRS